MYPDAIAVIDARSYETAALPAELSHVLNVNATVLGTAALPIGVPGGESPEDLRDLLSGHATVRRTRPIVGAVAVFEGGVFTSAVRGASDCDVNFRQAPNGARRLIHRGLPVTHQLYP